MLDQSEYADLRIRILKREAEGYPIEITLNHALEFRRGYLDLEIMPWVPSASPADDGRRLFQHLLADDRVKAAWAEVRGRYSHRRVRLRIDEAAPELHTIPWELLREERESGFHVNLAAADATPFSRYLAGKQEAGISIQERPVRILVAIANPVNLDQYNLQPIQVEEEWAQLQDALAGLDVDLIPVGQPCTLESLEEKLEAHRVHILHFVGHGAYGGSVSTAVLFMADSDNQVRRVPAGEHARMIARHLADVRHASLRLVFLSSCQTATRSPADAFRGFAPELVTAGVPAVLAMQDLVPVETARAFTRVFYQKLLQHGLVDLASNQARAALLTGQRSGGYIPVLFMRLRNGRLLERAPVVSALESIRKDARYELFSDADQYLPLPLEVLHLTGQQDFRSFDETETEATAAMDLLAAVRAILGLRSEPQAPDKTKPTIVALMGGYGCNKSTQLSRIVWEVTQDSLANHGKGLILPVYVDLEQFPTIRRTLRDPIEELVLEDLKPNWPDLTPSKLAHLLQSRTTLCLLFDHGGSLTDRQHRRACERIRRFAMRHPQHHYIIATSSTSFCHDLFADLDLHILVIQPLERRMIRRFLLGLPETDPSGGPLLKRLDESGLYDVASVPWFLVKMVQRGRTGRYPESRAQVLRQMIEDAIAALPAGQGMQAHAEEVLYALAWRMQSTLTTTLPLVDAFEIMNGIRGSREYSLEEFYKALVQARLLARAGPDSLRFAYGRFRAYCCAETIVRRDNRDQVLDDITASLGRLTRLRWWEETLIFVSGLLADDAQSLNRFLSVIVYGVNLLESEQTFLVARCLMEGKQHMSRGRQDRSLDLINRLERQVIAALVWRLSSRNEPRALHRSRAAFLLGQLASASAIEHLAQTAYGKPRQDRHGEPDFDYSNVRMAAVVGLLRMTQVAREELLKRIDPVLVELLHSWQKGDIDRLTRWLHSPEDRSARAIAALALGDLHMQLLLSEGKEKEADAALCELANAFLCPEIDEPTLWAVTYALAMLDLPIVRDAVFLPFFERERELFVDDEQRLLHYKCMGYLIGLLRWQEQKAYDFLVGSCLKDARKARLAAVAIQALGSLADRRYKPLLDMIALGNFTGILPHIDAPSSSFAYLQRKAIDALGKVGDLESVALLREHRRIEEMGSGGWDPALERALYRTSEEIFWRLNWNLRV